MYVKPAALPRLGRLYEFNPCHDPKDGQFSGRGTGACEGGEQNPDASRTTYGQDYEGSDLRSRVESLGADAAFDFGEKLWDSNKGDASSLKDKIASDLGDSLDKSCTDEELQAVAEEFDVPFSKPKSESDTWEELESTYSSDYENYEESFQNQKYDEAYGRYAKLSEEADQVALDAADDLHTLADEARAELNIEDMSGVGVLPGLDVTQDSLRPIGDVDPTAADVASFIIEHGMVGDLDSDTLTSESFALDDYEGDERAAIVETLGHWRSFPDRAEVARLVLESSDNFEFDDTDSAKREKWMDSELSSPDEYAMSFKDWYIDAHGKPDFESGDDDGSDDGYTLGQRVANYFIGRWADTSGDSSQPSIEMQYAVDTEFPELGTKQLRSEFKAHQPHGGSNNMDRQFVMRKFVRAMYDSTQARLGQLGYGPNDMVPLFRGMEVPTHEGLDVLPTRGAIVDVRLQPASSFSTSVSSAVNFSGHDGPGYSRAMVMMSVPRKQILSTALTGFGCLNEKELVVLGGRFPAYLTKDPSTFHDQTKKARVGLVPNGAYHLQQAKDDWLRSKKYFVPTTGKGVTS